MQKNERGRKVNTTLRLFLSVFLTAFAFVGLAAATYAWFSTNSELEADRVQIRMSKSIYDASIVFYPVTDISDNVYTYDRESPSSELPVHSTDDAGIFSTRYQKALVGVIRYSMDTDVEGVNIRAVCSGEWKDASSPSPESNYISNCVQILPVYSYSGNTVTIVTGESIRFVTVDGNGQKSKQNILIGQPNATELYFVLTYIDDDIMSGFANSTSVPFVVFENDIIFTIEAK